MSNQEIVPIIAKYNKLRSLVYFLLFLIFSLFIFFAYADYLVKLVSKDMLLKDYMGMIIGIGFLFFSIMTLKGAIVEIRKVFYKYPVLIINEKGIEYEQNFSSWKHIQNITIQLSAAKSRSYDMIIFLKEIDEAITIDLDSLNMPKEKIEKTARYFFKHDQNSID